MPLRHLLVLAAVALVLPAAASAAGPGSTILIDRPTGLGALPFDGASDSMTTTNHLLSADGQRAVFESDADQLLPPAANAVDRHVFVRDRAADTTTHVDTRQDGTPGNGSAFNASISGDGTKVAFLSDATNLTADAVSGVNAYVKSLTTGSVVLASRRTTAGGTAANSADDPTLDADGSRVVFTTQAALDAVADTNGVNDVYLRDLDTNTTTLMSRATMAGGAVGASASGEPTISGDGLVVAFDTISALDAVNDFNLVTDVYTRSGTTTTLISRLNGAGTAAGSFHSQAPSLNATGSIVAFVSMATNLVAGDTNNQADIFTRSGTTTARHNLANGGTATQANGDSYGATLSADGTRIAFVSAATNLVAGTSGAVYRSYVRTVGATTTTVVSRANGAAGAIVSSAIASLSSDATKVLFASEADALGGAGGGIPDVYVRDTGANATEIVSIPTGTTVPRAGVGETQLEMGAISDDGRYVVFSSRTDGLGTPGFGNHVYLRDTLTNTTTQVDNAGGGQIEAVISGDGSTVVYSSEEQPILRGVGPATNVYAYRVATGVTTIVGRADGAGGALPDAAASSPAVSRDGNRVAFRTSATNLDPVNDGNGDTDVYLRDLVANTTTLVSRRDGAGTPAGDDGSTLPSIDSEGRRVAFASDAADLVTGDANGRNDVFVRDVVANTTTLVSRPSGAGTPPGNDDSRASSISGDGTKVAFESEATDLGDGGGDADEDVYLRDLSANTTTLMSRVGASGPTADQGADIPYLSRDGSTVAYRTNAANVLGFATNESLVVVRRIADGSTTIGSRGDGASGPLPNSAFSPSLSADGGCLAFLADGGSLVPGGYASPDYRHVYLRTLSGECPKPAPSPAPPGTPPISTPLPRPTTPALPVDRTAPVISSATLSPKTFAAAAGARAAQKKRKVARGTTVRFRLSEAASVVLTAMRRERGRRWGRRCVKSTARLVRRKAKVCTRYVAKGVVRVAGKAGANRLSYTGRIGRRALPRARYRLLVDATDAARNKARTKTLTFTVVKP